MLHTPIGRLRTMGFIEGMSLLVLLFIAMPLKYWAHHPLAVTIAGSIHGGWLSFIWRCWRMRRLLSNGM